MKREDITQELLRSIFVYDPITGDLARRGPADNPAAINPIPKKTQTLSVKGVTFKKERLIWMYMFNEHPKHAIIYFDGDNTNTKLENLKKKPPGSKINEVFIRDKVAKEGHELVGYNLDENDPHTTRKHHIVVKLKDGKIYETTWFAWIKGSRKPRIKIDEARARSLVAERDGYTFIKLEKSGPKVKAYLTVKHEECGNKYTTSFHDFERGAVCRFCVTQGENSGRWKGGVSKTGFAYYDTAAPQLEYAHKVSKIMVDGIPVLAVACHMCDEMLIPSLNAVYARIAHLEGKNHQPREFYCSDECRAACKSRGKTPKQITKLARINAGLEEEPEVDRPLQKEWADMVKEAAGWCCEICGKHIDELYKNGEQLIAHHIEPVIRNPILSADVDNGVALCTTHNKYVHGKKGCSPAELRCN